ncbi:hypothetical protein C5167_027117, partial [Papaver somniferum]
MSVHGLELNSGEFSTSQIWIQNGPSETLNSIEFGWMDLQTGNWWLTVDDITIGYWPKEIFTHLANNALVIRYGGIAGTKSQRTTPPMGNGYLPQLQNFLKTAYMTRMKYVDEKGQFVNINPYGAQTKQDTTSNCYNILFVGNLGADWEISMAFGGPG